MSDQADFDIIIYGATGFTGRLVVEYMLTREPEVPQVRWAMAGRSADKLAAVRDEVGAPTDTPLIVADADQPETLDDLVRQTRCVLSTVGPYTHYGEPLVAACARNGTDYVDLSGEVLWMKDMIEHYGSAARASGARIVHSCGFDSVPFDLGVQYLQEEAVRRFGGACPRVRGRMRAMQGTFSGGTAASGAATLAAVQKDPSLFNVLIDPFALAEGFKGPEQPAGNKVAEEDGVWVAPFVMAPINTKNIHRTNALAGHPYGEEFVYDEMMVTGPGEDGRKAAESVANMQIGGDDAPKPGEGPSRAEREAGFYDYLAIGTGPAGETLRVAVKGDRDPGYGSTSKIIAEAAICLVRDCGDVPGGIYTPGAAMGARVRERLIARAGLTFDVET